MSSTSLASPSTLSASAGSSSPSASSSSKCSAGPCAPPPATLYLFTFLSTIIILFLVAGGLLLRGYVLRRRQFLAIANGTWVPPGRLQDAPRPEMYEIYINGKHSIRGAEPWGSFKPLSAAPIPSIPTPPDVHATTPSIRRALYQEIRHTWRLYSPFHPPPTSAYEEQLATPAEVDSQVRVAAFVSMPSQEGVDEGLPHLEFGVVDVDMAQPRRKSSDLQSTSNDGGGS
ncbi:hypothetical protein FB45DRAFT_894821 [Roridomyces roridus]|uniref:Uncharacterized protein n=1 Tax=Roridomyces roridus TaxID=1738132 RepID=A0AAD7CGN9_9AGAR|nr:hypothetical protein FB45DRAFT_894821 [Roridomyces roridus]